jgi:CRISPR system Cascade subunit CasB
MSEARPPYALALSWWSGLQPSAPGGGDRGALASLRRCSCVAEAMGEPASIALFRALGFFSPERFPDAALLAAVLAHVREHAPNARFARAIGPQQADDDALVSALRFRRLMQAETHDELLIAFRRAIALARGVAHVSDLARGLLHWNEETRTRWVFDYWNATDRTTEKPAEIVA